jgi:hypothetical protein
MASVYAGEGNVRDFDEVHYDDGTVGKKVAGGWQYDWRKDPYQDVLSDSDIASQRAVTQFRNSNPGMHVAEDDVTAAKQMRGEAGLYANDAQGNNSGQPAAPATPAAAWNAPPKAAEPAAIGNNNTPTPPAGLTPSLPVTAPGDTTPTTKARSALYDELWKRIQQPITPDPNDPTIRRQADAYSAAATRNTRDMLSNMAEHAGPYANLTGEERLANERAAQASGGFEAQLIGREQDARRESIQADLQNYGSLLSDDERTQLAEELGLLGASNTATGNANALTLGLDQNANTRRGQDLDYDAILRRLGLDSWVQDDYRRSGI